MVHQEEWENALAILQSTNNSSYRSLMPCTLREIMCNWNQEPAIETIEKILSKEVLLRDGLNQPPVQRTGKTVAVLVLDQPD
jgi:glutamate synthase (NADPH/NADH) small chain